MKVVEDKVLVLVIFLNC